MSYRSFKRVLGENSIERKCRLLFGSCLLLLITGSFWWYGKRTENLVHEKNESTGRQLVDAFMLKYHFRKWGTKGEWEDKGGWEDFVKAMTEDLENLDYTAELLALDEDFIGLGETEANELRPPTDVREERILRKLKSEYDALLEEIQQGQQAGGQANSPSGPAAGGSLEGAPVDMAPAEPTDPLKGPELPFWGRPMPDLKEYHYYQPVYWKTSCTIGCHQRIQDLGVVPVYETIATEPFPFCVVKITIPYASTQEAITANRAFLAAIAIVTVFLAMVALYIVVRYVIVKPLQHLRDVSDQIAGGNYLVRAEIHTNDEFEDLAHSFNRMLRHLVDAHEELRNVNADLDAKVDQLAQANMQLYEANRLKSDFLANMSHELRTPLNSIIGFSDVLQSIDSLNDKQKRYVRNIGQSGRVLLDMINDILDLAKMESGKMEVSPTEFSIEMIVQAQCNVVQSLSEERNIDLEVAIRSDLPKMCQDQGKVQQILTNLLSNAIKFTPEGGRIVVTVDRSADEEFLLLQVADTGVGIAKEDQEVIFEKFRQGTALRQGDDLTREFSGTGLGLSIVKELSKLLGGEITFESELGKGSTFTVRLPWRLREKPRHDAMTAPRGANGAMQNGAPSLAARRASDVCPAPAAPTAPGGSRTGVPGVSTPPFPTTGE